MPYRICILVCFFLLTSCITSPTEDTITQEVRNLLLTSSQYHGEERNAYEHEFDNETCRYEEFIYLVRAQDPLATHHALAETFITQGWAIRPGSTLTIPNHLIRDDRYRLGFSPATFIYGTNIPAAHTVPDAEKLYVIVTRISPGLIACNAY